MCGICGILNRSGRPADPVLLERMATSLTHRGPDDAGYYVHAQVGLGHRRLNIIDLDTGHQPIFNENGRCVLIFNGEIYNYLELRRGLAERGHVFSTKTDTEVILHLYEEKQERCLEDLRGMFSFALWDDEKKELFFARDRLGKKPFFYYVDDERFLFASEIKAVLKNDISRDLDTDAVFDFFKYQFIPSPRTIFRKIRKLPPGHFGKVSKNSFVLNRYWDIPVREDGFQGRSLASLEDELDSLLSEATKIRLISDVPLGAFLSGGLDSSLVVALMKKHSNAPVKTFAIGFKEKSYDESGFAARAAQAIQTDHKKFDVEYRILDILETLVAHFDEPFGDSSAIPTYYLSQFTKENVTVALSGDGGDELFGGYRRYIAHKLGRFFTRIPSGIRKFAFENPVKKLPVRSGYYGTSLTKKLKLFAKASQRIESGRFYLPQIFEEPEVRSVFGDRRLRLRTHAYDDLLYAEFRKADRFDDLTKLMWFDLHYYLPDDILVKVDRMSMRHSLEVRAPYLDQRVVEYAFNLPLEFKIHRLTGKYILKKIARNYLPRDIVARKKQGFMVPLDAWFKAELIPLFTEKVLNNEMFERAVVERIFRDHMSGRDDYSVKMWLLLSFAIFMDTQKTS